MWIGMTALTRCNEHILGSNKNGMELE